MYSITSGVDYEIDDDDVYSYDYMYFTRPPFAEIAHNLYMGECPSGTLDERFVAVLNLFPWEDYKTGKDVEMISVEMEDSSRMLPDELLMSLASWVNEQRERGPVLVHCQAGLNRSGLITALALMLEGTEPHKAISLIREKRSPMALCNSHFTKWLRGKSLNSNKEREYTNAIPCAG